MTWSQRIDRAEKAGGFTFRDRLLAADFKTCAVPEAVGHRKFEHPDSLHEPGLEFLAAICLDNFAKARELLKKIRAIARKEPKVPREVERRKR